MSKTKKRAMIESDSDDSGSSDVDQEIQSQAKRPKPAPPLPSSGATRSSSSGSSSESGSDDEWTMDGKEKRKAEKEKKKGKGGRVQMGKRMPAGKKAVTHSSSSDSSDEEEGEEGRGDYQGMSQSTSSSDSGSSESDSSSDESVQFDDGLDDELVGDEEDRRKLADMTEAEREQEMYLRYEKRQVLKARFEIEQKLRRARRVKKRKAKEVREKEQLRMVRKSRRSRQEDVSKSKAMDELKAKRSADKQKREEQQRQQQQQMMMKEPLNAADVFSSGSDEESSSSSGSGSEGGDSEDEGGGRSLSALRDAAPQYISTLDGLSKIKLSRFRLEKWVHMPFFRDVAVGCFVRVGIGAHEGRMVYRVCEITDVTETPKIYSLGSTKTNKCLRLRHGQQDRSFRMEFVSNSPFTDSEFSKWKNELEQRGVSPPTMDFVGKKTKQIEEARNFQFKEEDIDKILEEKQKFRKAPTNYAMTKSRLLRLKELAEQEGNSERVTSLAQQLSELEEKAEQLDKQRSKGLSAISYINERNRQRNVSRAEQALKEEMADDKKKKDDDPFTRRRCKPTLVTLTKDPALDTPLASQLLQQYSQAQTSEDKEAIKATLREAAPQILSPTTPNGQSSASITQALEATPDLSLFSSTPAPPQPVGKNVEDLFSAHDFDIQIDLPSTPEGSAAVKTMNKSVSTPRAEAPKRSLNLADYKKRRGLI